MNKKEYYGHPRFYEILEELAELHSKKNKDFATKEDPLANFRRVAELCRKHKLITEGLEELKICLIYLQKQADACFKLVGTREKAQVEGVRERLEDMAVYSVIGMILYEEYEKNEKV